MLTFTILLGGRLCKTERLLLQTQKTKIIAADSGIRHHKIIKIKPILWIGDFDSTTNNMIKIYKNIPKITYPINKDMTDGELAVNKALNMGAKKIILCGAFGGKRMDHNILHIMIAIKLSQVNIPSILTSGNEEGWPLFPGNHRFNFPKNSIFSIIAFSYISGLSIYGAKWSINNASLKIGSSYMLSNKQLDNLSISIKNGIGILLVKIF